MAQALSPLTAFSETQEVQALERLTIIRPASEKEIIQAQVAYTHQLSFRTDHLWLTAIEDDYNRAIASYCFTFQEPTALIMALVLRTAIWRKEDPRWHVCSIPKDVK
jgi:transposase InsO family protein